MDTKFIKVHSVKSIRRWDANQWGKNISGSCNVPQPQVAVAEVQRKCMQPGRPLIELYVSLPLEQEVMRLLWASDN